MRLRQGYGARAPGCGAQCAGDGARERTSDVTQSTTRRDFIRTVGAGAVAAAGTIAAPAAAAARPVSTPAKSRILGANDRINVGFVGCGGRMNTHITHVMGRNKAKGDVQAIAVNDIWETRKKLAQREDRRRREVGVYHDYRELVVRPDIDAVVIGSPDHWHYAHAMAALEAGKDVYLEKPMTYTVDEARKIAEYVKTQRPHPAGRQPVHLARSLPQGEEGDRRRADRRGGVGLGRLRAQQHEARQRVELQDRPRRQPVQPRLEGVHRQRAEARLGSGALLPLAQVLGLLGRHRDRPLLPHGLADPDGGRAGVPGARDRGRRHLRAEGPRGARHVLHERRLPATGRCSWRAR